LRSTPPSPRITLLVDVAHHVAALRSRGPRAGGHIAEPEGECREGRDVASQDFTENVLKLEDGYVALLDDGSTFVSFVLPPSDSDDERYSSLSDRLRELADNFSVNSF